MHHEMIIAGFGGQGVILAGMILAWSANMEGKAVVWSPSYGPEMRGGPSHCTVTISTEHIGSPIVARPDSEIIMDEPSLGRFVGRLKPGGLLLMNSSLVRSHPDRDDIRKIALPANRIAEEMGDVRAANVVMMGALLGLVPVVGQESLRKTFEERWGKRPKILEMNLQALRAGMEQTTKT